MSRKGSNPSRTTLPDPKHGSDVIARFINMVMQSGKKSVAEKIVYGALDQIGEKPRGFVLDLSRVPFVDETAAHALIAFFGKAQKRGVRVAVAGVQRPVLRTLLQNGLDRRMVIMAPDVDAARKRLSITVDKALAQDA